MNALFTKLFDSVVALTARPDLAAQTKQAIKSSTLRAHNSGFYWRDIAEYSLKFDTPSNLQKVKITQIIPTYRSIRYLRKYDGSVAGDFLKVITPEESLDSYARNVLNVCYTAGDQLNILSSEELSYALLGCYVSPIVTEEDYSSWIAMVMENVIINDAARIIFKTIGYDEQATTYAELVKQDFEYLADNYVQQNPA